MKHFDRFYTLLKLELPRLLALRNFSRQVFPNHDVRFCLYKKKTKYKKKGKTTRTKRILNDTSVHGQIIKVFDFFHRNTPLGQCSKKLLGSGFCFLHNYVTLEIHKSFVV